MSLENVSISLQGFAEECDAIRIGRLMGDVIAAIGEYIDLERLEGVTIAYDYEGALRGIDCGYETDMQNSPTRDSSGVGVAMAKHILVGDCVKIHIVFNALYIEPLDDPEHELFREVVSLIAHECAHVEDMKVFDSKFPGVLLKQKMLASNYQFDAIYPAWQEYSACRISSKFCSEGTLKAHLDILESSLSCSLQECRAAIRTYRLHGDILRVWKEAGVPLFAPMRYVSYLFGYIDGIGLNMEECPRLVSLIDENDFYCSHLRALHAEFQALWNSRDIWESLDVFSNLNRISDGLYAAGGLRFEVLENGNVYIDVPFFSETIPH